MVVLGIVFAGAFAWLLYGDIGSAPWTFVRKLRRAATKNAPWVLLSSLAAAPSLLLTWWWRTVHKDQDHDLALRAANLAAREERNTRFVESVKLLADTKVESRLGGIYSLDSLARDAAEEVPRVVATLSAFVRTHARALPIPNDAPAQPIEVRAALATVCSLPRTVALLDLSGAKLEFVEANAFDLSAALLHRVNLSGAILRRAKLEGSSLIGADIRNALLSDANLIEMHAVEAHFDGCIADHATFAYARLTLATFAEARLTAADFHDVQALSAKFQKADLRGANFENADLSSGDFTEADLTGANLLGSNLRNAKLDGALLQGALYDDHTNLPQSVEPSERGMVKASV